MRCGLPVILSDVTSLPEIGGDAAIYADPGDIITISDAMTRVAGNEELRAAMSRAGYDQSLKFNWEDTARSVWRSIELTLHGQK
jgi:glycosyltransferase involved in cell wall biosynthesis